ncbi:unnamed protein product, partial [Prorocentrum cordatum]
ILIRCYPRPGFVSDVPPPPAPSRDGRLHLWDWVKQDLIAWGAKLFSPPGGSFGADKDYCHIGISELQLLLLKCCLLLGVSVEMGVEFRTASHVPSEQTWRVQTDELGRSVKESVAAGNKTVLELLEAVRQTVQDNQATMDEKILSVVRPQVDDVSRRLQAQLDAQRNRIGEHDRRLEAHDTAIDTLNRRLDDMQRALALASGRPQPPPRVPAGFDRGIDGTIVVAMAQKHTTVAHVRGTLQPFISGLGYESTEYEIKASGDEPSKRFVVAFKGAVAPATRKAHTVLQNLKVDKQWREFTVGVTGSADCRLFLGPDRSPKQIKTEILLRRCRSEIANVYPQAKLFSDRERGCLLVGWDKILKVEVGAGQDESKLHWEPNRITKNNMDIERLRACTKCLVDPAAEAGGQKSSLKKHYLSRLRLQETVVALQEEFTDKVLVIILGDFNFAAEEALILDSPVAAVKHKPWGGMLELEHSLPTHFDRHAGTEAAIDRIFASWQACQLYVMASTLDALACVSDKGISDHAAVIVSLTPRSARLPETRCVPKHVCQDPWFQKRLAGLASDSKWDLLSPPFQLEHCKGLAKIAGEETRDHMFKTLPEHPKTLLLLSRVIARLEMFIFLRLPLDFCDVS